MPQSGSGKPASPVKCAYFVPITVFGMGTNFICFFHP